MARVKRDPYNDGYEDGYEDGYQDGLEALEAMREEIDSLSTQDAFDVILWDVGGIALIVFVVLVLCYVLWFLIKSIKLSIDEAGQEGVKKMNIAVAETIKSCAWGFIRFLLILPLIILVIGVLVQVIFGDGAGWFDGVVGRLMGLGPYAILLPLGIVLFLLIRKQKSQK